MKAAAGALSITPAALGQRIRALEDYLGFDLLVRGRSGIQVSANLQDAVPHLNAAFRELETVCNLLDFQRVNELHIVADTDFAELWLKPRLRQFRGDNPNTRFCINGIGDVPMRIGAADCEIWFGEEEEGESSDHLFHDYLLPVGSPENARRILAVKAANILEGFPLLHLDSYTTKSGAIGWREWIAAYGYRRSAPERGIRYQKIMHALEAVLADSGMLLCGLAMIKPKLDAGLLALPFPLSKGRWSRSAYRCRFSADARRRNNTAKFRDWLLAEATLCRAEIESIVGTSPAGVSN